VRGLSGKVAVVVGAGSGIGRATAQRLAEEGASVAVVDVDGTAAAATVSELERTGGRGLALGADATSPEDVARAVERISKTFGGLDVLVNSVARAPRKTMYDITASEWRDTVDACLFSYFTTTRSALPHLVSRGGGKIVNVCSVTAHVGAQLPAYTAAKGAVLAWSREIAVEFAHHGITVNTVSPGVIETRSTPKSSAPTRCGPRCSTPSPCNGSAGRWTSPPRSRSSPRPTPTSSPARTSSSTER
jgi:NAD(P)-dependent dehydrogenase (short-subunit alcohol dehydrogenase family)